MFNLLKKLFSARKSLVLIPGITNRMGEEFASGFSKLGNFEIVGFTNTSSKVGKGVYKCDFLKTSEIEDTIRKINLGKYNQIYLIHSIGPFKFEEDGKPETQEDLDNDGIDDTILSLNLTTFVNITNVILHNKSESQQVTLCAFGSVSDKYEIPWWGSYSKSKNLLRKYISSLSNEKVRGVVINVSSTEKEYERPFADKTYWLSCKEVAKKSIPLILQNQLHFLEFDIIKPNPNYSERYFKDLNNLKLTWKRQLYGHE